MLLLLRRELVTVEFAFEEDHTEQVQQVDLLGIVIVVDRGSQCLDDRPNDDMLDLAGQVSIVLD